MSAFLAAKFFELTLILIWLCFIVIAVGERSHARYLAVWDVVAAIYVVLGMLAIRRRRGQRATPIGRHDVGPWLRPLCGARLEFATILGASLAGLSSAVTVLYYATGKIDALQGVGALAIVFAWILLHAGDGRFYAVYYESLARGRGAPLAFPRDDHPTVVDFFYFSFSFSFTLGTSFAVSDVAVVTPSMRWHVMMHSVLSFFYNAAVLALAVGILRPR
ncbi:MAG: DUF1345 domain-containing protein [Streptosporangiaceae bacterium]